MHNFLKKMLLRRFLNSGNIENQETELLKHQYLFRFDKKNMLFIHAFSIPFYFSPNPSFYCIEKFEIFLNIILMHHVLSQTVIIIYVILNFSTLSKTQHLSNPFFSSYSLFTAYIFGQKTKFNDHCE